MIKPKIKDNEEIWDCVSRVFKRWADPPMPGDEEYDEFRQEIEREIAQFYIDKCYKEMLRQFVNLIFQGESLTATEEGELVNFHRDFNREEIRELVQPFKS